MGVVVSKEVRALHVARRIAVYNAEVLYYHKRLLTHVTKKITDTLDNGYNRFCILIKNYFPKADPELIIAKLNNPSGFDLIKTDIDSIRDYLLESDKMINMNKRVYDNPEIKQNIKHFHNSVKTFCVDKTFEVPLHKKFKSIDSIVEECAQHGEILITGGTNFMENKDYFQVEFKKDKIRIWYDLRPESKTYFVEKYDLMEVF